jgi:hypothetical protein
MIPARPVRGIIPVASVNTAETVMDGGDTAVETTGVEPAAMEPTMEPPVETAAMEAATVETAAVPSASASVGEIWLAEDSRAQYRSCNTRHSL